MKNLKQLFLVVLLVSGSAFAFNAKRAGSYVGGGEWRMPTGESGKYHHTTTIAKAKGGLAVHERLVIHEPGGTKHVEEMDFSIHHTSKGYFDVNIDGSKAGWGYCMKRTCHMTLSHKGRTSEETFHFAKKGRRVMRIGSDVGKDFTVTWSGTMKPKHSGG